MAERGNCYRRSYYFTYCSDTTTTPEKKTFRETLRSFWLKVWRSALRWRLNVAPLPLSILPFLFNLSVNIPENIISREKGFRDGEM